MKLSPVHPGEILLGEFLEPMEVSQYRLAKETRVPARRINEIVQGKRSVSADTAIRLAGFFGTSEMFWMHLQAAYDLDIAKLALPTATTSASDAPQRKIAKGRAMRTSAATARRSTAKPRRG